MEREFSSSERGEPSQGAPPKLVSLPNSFYAPSAESVAPSLLGHWLIRLTPEGPSGGLVVEAEAYLAEDPACHAFRGETPRNRSMFGPPGRAYVYFIYGNHWCFNAVCRPAGVGEAVLVRAIEPCFGLPWMAARRPVVTPRDLTNGPAKLCAALDIDRRLDGANLCDDASPVFIARNPGREEWLRTAGPIVVAARVGISRAADAPLRFYVEGSGFVSRRLRPNKPKPAAASARARLKGMARD